MEPNTEKNVIDITKLENLKEVSDGWISRCPVCALAGNDKTGNHLRIWKTAAFKCIVDSSSEHNISILNIAGTNGNGEVLDHFRPNLEPEPEFETIYPEEVLTKLIRNFDYWKGRGISHETMARFEGGIAVNGKMAGRWVLPLRNKNSQIIGFTGRWIGQSKEGVAKWKHLSKISKVIFPNFIKIKDIVVLLESPGDAISLIDNGIDHVRVMFGVELSSALMSDIISKNPQKIIISTNNDSSAEGRKKNVGNKAAEKIKNRLLSFFDESSIVIRLPQTGKDWGEATKEEIQEFKKEIYGN
jgi:hypothetical protein